MSVICHFVNVIVSRITSVKTRVYFTLFVTFFGATLVTFVEMTSNSAAVTSVRFVYLMFVTDSVHKLFWLLKGQKKATVSCHTPNRVYTK